PAAGRSLRRAPGAPEGPHHRRPVPQDHFMNRTRTRFAPSFAADHGALERRIALSGAAAYVAGAAHQAATHTTLAVRTETLGTPLAVNVSVRAAASAGAPQGTVHILD